MAFDPVTFGAAVNMAKDPAKIKASVEDWLDDHPEATTTVQDGSITKAKLHDDLADEINENTSDIGVLKSILEPAATSADVGKVMMVKAVENGKVTAWELVEVSGTAFPSASGVNF